MKSSSSPPMIPAASLDLKGFQTLLTWCEILGHQQILFSSCNINSRVSVWFDYHLGSSFSTSLSTSGTTSSTSSTTSSTSGSTSSTSGSASSSTGSASWCSSKTTTTSSAAASAASV
ncbi:hypothetical protein OGATHE_005937 [Ogataea polymorpha]|uniref:Uncharacterized protein n=1 Tax=Ogataea polymorpha TaxID=460523 RepID=A0A9P8NVC1_9ASCO|nr:hypothetical protein OGATHE_005937 [Ogataea polymorpha]